MPSTDPEPRVREESTRLWPAMANAALWGAGSGLAGVTLIVYLVNSLGVNGLGVSLVLAAPYFVGVARIGAIRFTRRCVSRKRFCIAAYLASGLLLGGLRALAQYAETTSLGANGPFSGQQQGPMLGRAALAGAVALWCGYHLLEYMGTVALWSWIKALVPLDRMGAFIGRRAFYLQGCRALGMLAGGMWAYRFEPTDWKLFADLALGFCSEALLIASAVVLLFLPNAAGQDAGESAKAPAPPRWRDVFTPFLDPRVAPVVAYGCWFSFFNGFTQIAQTKFAINVLALDSIVPLGLASAMTLGQALVSPSLGKLADRRGNRSLMFVSQVIVGVGLAGYLLANDSRPWLIGLAALAWVAYAGIDIGVPNLLLKLSPPGQVGACVAGYDAMTGVFHGASMLVGALAFDALQGQTVRVQNFDLNRYQYLFYLGVVTRIMGAGLLPRIREKEAGEAGGRSRL